MKRQIIFAAIAVVAITLSATAVSAEEWEKSLDLSLNATQASYSDSWTGGEAGNFTWAANGSGIFTRQFSPMLNLKNTVKLAFGQTINQDKDDKTWSKPVKSTDKIDLEAVALFTHESFVKPYAALRFESQFLDASVETNKRYINPILLTESAGFARPVLKQDKNDILTRLGFAVKHNINRGVISATDSTKKETKAATDGGIESVTDAKIVLNDKLGYLGKLTLYRALFYSKKSEVKETEAEDYWKAVDINWENTITASIAKYVQVSLYVQFLYDKQISKKGRIKETLSLGLTYKLL